MNLQIPRLRIFAGPNGSGKSTLQKVISKELLGIYINPDEIEEEIKEFDYIATHDPLINISRVKYRVSMGGHDVPEDKIISRYSRSLENLWPAIQFSNRAYIFDNSSHHQAWICEITNGKELDIKHHTIPPWVDQFVIEKHKNLQEP